MGKNMLVGNCYNVLIVSASDDNISAELETAKSVLDRWNRKYSHDIRHFFILDTDSGKNLYEIDINKLKEADLLITIFSTNSIDPRDKKKIQEYNNSGYTLFYIIKNLKTLIQNSERSGSSREEDIMKYIKDNKYESHYREFWKEEFGFNLTCDISAFNIFYTPTTITFATVNIKVNGAKKKGAKLTFLVSGIVHSQEKPIKLEDRVTSKSGTILSFEPQNAIIHREQKELLNKKNQSCHLIEFKREATDKQDEALFFTYETVIRPEKLSYAIMTVAYFTQYLIVNLDTTNAEFIDIAHPITAEVKKSSESKSGEKQNPESIIKNGIYCFKFEKISAKSDIIFNWKEKNTEAKGV